MSTDHVERAFSKEEKTAKKLAEKAKQLEEEDRKMALLLEAEEKENAAKLKRQ